MEETKVEIARTAVSGSRLFSAIKFVVKALPRDRDCIWQEGDIIYIKGVITCDDF
jgi:hypothetical protein